MEVTNASFLRSSGPKNRERSLRSAVDSADGRGDQETPKASRLKPSQLFPKSQPGFSPSERSHYGHRRHFDGKTGSDCRARVRIPKDGALAAGAVDRRSRSPRMAQGRPPVSSNQRSEDGGYLPQNVNYALSSVGDARPATCGDGVLGVTLLNVTQQIVTNHESRRSG